MVSILSLSSSGTSWTFWLAALVAVAPGVVSWRLHAPLLRRLDDPVLPERLLSCRPWTMGAWMFATTVTLFAWPEHALWAIPLSIVASQRAMYGVRRIAFDENLTFTAYLLRQARHTLAGLGFWLLLAFAPGMIFAAGRFGPLVAIVLAAVLIAWEVWFREAFLWLWRAVPLGRDDPSARFVDLSTRFDEMLDRTRLAPPSLYRAGEPGGVIINAFALPSLRGASVLFTRTLLERMTVEEIAAIFAHELAHLESFTPGRLRALTWITRLLIASAIGLVPLLTFRAEERLFAAVMIWPLVVAATLMVRASQTRTNELAADRRAVELCGSGEALASVLSRMHAMARLPRRWQVSSAAHPSLAQRLRSIREAAGQEAPALTDPVVIDGAVAGSFTIVDPEAIRYLTGTQDSGPDSARVGTPASVAASADAAAGVGAGAGVDARAGDAGASDAGASPAAHDDFDAAPAALAVPPDDRQASGWDANALVASAASVRRLTFDRVRDVRIDARGTRPPELQVVGRDGERLGMALREADVPRVHALMDAIEPRLTPGAPHEPSFDNRLPALAMLAAGFLAGPAWSVVLLAGLALMRPVRDLLLAAASMSIACGVLSLIDPRPDIAQTQSSSALGALVDRIDPATLSIVVGILTLGLMVLQRRRAITSSRGPGRGERALVHVGDKDDDAPTWSVALVVCLALVVSIATLIQWDGNLLRFVQIVRDSPAAVLLPLGAAVLCLRTQTPRRRAAAAGFALAALLSASMVPVAFQNRVVRDPLLGVMPEIPRLPATVSLVGQTALARGTVMRVSPSAHATAIGWPTAKLPVARSGRGGPALRDRDDAGGGGGDDAGGGDPTLGNSAFADPAFADLAGAGLVNAFDVRATDGRVEQLVALDLQFVDEERVLLLRRAGMGLELTLHALWQTPRIATESAMTSTARGSATVPTAPELPGSSPGVASRSARGTIPAPGSAQGWTMGLPDFEGGRLSVDARTGRWRVAGRDRRGDVVRVEGVLGNEIVEEARWQTSALDDERSWDPVEALVDGSRALLAVRTEWPESLLTRLSPWMAWGIATVSSQDVSLWRVDVAGTPTRLIRSAADVTCLEPLVNGGQTICLAFDGVSTRLWSIEAERGVVTPVGLLPGYAHALSRAQDGSTLVWWQRRALIVHDRSPRAIELEASASGAADDWPTRWVRGTHTPGHVVLFHDIDHPVEMRSPESTTSEPTRTEPTGAAPTGTAPTTPGSSTARRGDAAESQAGSTEPGDAGGSRRPTMRSGGHALSTWRFVIDARAIAAPASRAAADRDMLDGR